MKSIWRFDWRWIWDFPQEYFRIERKFWDFLRFHVVTRNLIAAVVVWYVTRWFIVILSRNCCVEQHSNRHWQWTKAMNELKVVDAFCYANFDSFTFMSLNQGKYFRIISTCCRPFSHKVLLFPESSSMMSKIWKFVIKQLRRPSNVLSCVAWVNAEMTMISIHAPQLRAMVKVFEFSLHLVLSISSLTEVHVMFATPAHTRISVKSFLRYNI